MSDIASGRRRLAGRSQISADFASGYGDAPTVLSTPSSLSTIWLEHPKWRRLARKTAINAIVLLSKSVSRARERATRGRLASHVGHRTGDAANQDWRPDLHRWIVSPGQTFQRTPDFSQGSYVRTLMEMQFLVQNRKLYYIFALVGSIERRSEENRTACRGTHGFFCNCQTGPQCWKPPSTGLILRRPLPEAKGLEGPSRGANEATNWTILRDVKLRFPPQDEVVGFGAIPKLHPGSFESFPFA